MAERLIAWVVPVVDEALPTVERLLDQIRPNPAANAALPFGTLRMVHFASLTLFDRDDPARRTLVFESNVDAPLRAYVAGLVRCGRRALDGLFAGADGYPGPTASDEAVVDHLLRSCRRPQLFHVGHPDCTTQEIRGDRELRRSIERELDEDPALRTMPPAEMIESLRRRANCPRFFRSCVRPWHSDWENPPSPDATPLNQILWLPDRLGLMRYVRELELLGIAALIEAAAVVLLGHYALVPMRATLAVASIAVISLIAMSAPDLRPLRGVVAASLVILIVIAIFKVAGIVDVTNVGPWMLVAAGSIAAPAAIVAASYLYIVARLTVSFDMPPLDAAARRRIALLMEAEDRPEHSIYNHVAGMSRMKDGYRLLRWLRSNLALSFLNLFYRAYFVRGKLLSIPSIHFAQWTLLRDRMLFVTNYDGSADSYLDDFFNSLAKGVAFIWYDMREFPDTTDPRGLKLWVRAGQTLAAVRYRSPAYDGLTVRMINNNLDIRRRLLRGRSARTARRWRRRFATNPIEPTLGWRLTHWATGGGTE